MSGIVTLEEEAKKYSVIFNQMVEENKDRDIQLNHQYWVSEWHWNHFIDGYGAYQETIRHHHVVDGLDVYTTGKNNRIYYKHDLCISEIDAKMISKQKMQFGYGWKNPISCNKVPTLYMNGWREPDPNTIHVNLSFDDVLRVIGAR